MKGKQPKMPTELFRKQTELGKKANSCTLIWMYSRNEILSTTSMPCQVTDDLTGFTWLFLLKTREGLIKPVKEIVELLEVQYGIRVKRVRSDNELVTSDISNFFKSKGHCP